MTDSWLVPQTQECAVALNTLARHQLIHRLLADIRLDLTICQIEGWDPTEYIRMLHAEIDSLYTSMTSGGGSE